MKFSLKTRFDSFANILITAKKRYKWFYFSSNNRNRLSSFSYDTVKTYSYSINGLGQFLKHFENIVILEFPGVVLIVKKFKVFRKTNIIFSFNLTIV